MKSLLLYFYRYCIIMCCFLCFSKIACAQTDADALMIAKNSYCAGLTYTYNSWTNYWEGTFKRDNGNIGKLSTNSYTMVGNYGITNKLNILFSVPYITTNASAGTLKGQSGFQDFTLTLKWLGFKQPIGSGSLNVFAIVSGSVPLSNYEADFVPMSIGSHSSSAMIRGLLNYKTGKFFVTGSAQFVQRGNITIDRNSYYTTQLIYSNQVYMPNSNNISFSTGYQSSKIYASASILQATTLGGFDIRKNDMPFPSNRMNATMAGALFKYSFGTVSGLELMAAGNYVLTGRNVGQSSSFTGGVLYLFNFSKKTTK